MTRGGQVHGSVGVEGGEGLQGGKVPFLHLLFQEGRWSDSVDRCLLPILGLPLHFPFPSPLMGTWITEGSLRSLLEQQYHL